jgi:myosin protein heavy chain
MKVKCCFIIDATASMQPWIDSAKLHIETCIREVTETYIGVNIEVSAIFYRDYNDRQPVVIIPFTSDTQDFKESIQDIEAVGGDDTCENVCLGFQSMMNLDWSNADIKHAFLMCDAPPHGRQWHDIYSEDDHLDHPDQFVLSDKVLNAAVQDIHLTVIRINSSIDKMIYIFRELYATREMTIDVEELASNEDANYMDLTQEQSTLISAVTRSLNESLSLRQNTSY